MASEHVSVSALRSPLGEARHHDGRRTSSSSAENFYLRAPLDDYTHGQGDQATTSARYRRPSTYRREEAAMLSPRLPAPREPSAVGTDAPPHFVFPDWKKHDARGPQAHARVFGGVLGYRPQPTVDAIDEGYFASAPLATHESRSSLLPSPVQLDAGRAHEKVRFFRRAEGLTKSKWYPDMCLAIAALGRVCYGFGPIAIEQQINLRPDTAAENISGSKSGSIPLSNSTKMALSELSAGKSLSEGPGVDLAKAIYSFAVGERQELHNIDATNTNGSNPSFFTGTATTPFSGWTIGLALFGIGLGVLGAFLLFKEAQKFNRRRAWTYFILHLFGIGLVTSGHIVADVASRHLALQERLIAFVPVAVGSGLHQMTIPASYSAAKYKCRGAASASEAAANINWVAPLRMVGTTLYTLWGASYIFPINPYVRDSMVIVANIMLIYAFALPMTDLRGWLGPVPNEPEMTDLERRLAIFQSRAAMGMLESYFTPSMILGRRPMELAGNEVAVGVDVVEMRSLKSAAEGDGVLPVEPLDRPELKRINTI